MSSAYAFSKACEGRDTFPRPQIVLRSANSQFEPQQSEEDLGFKALFGLLLHYVSSIYLSIIRDKCGIMAGYE